MPSYTNEDDSTVAGSGGHIVASLGATLTIASNAITVTDGIHILSGAGTLNTINGGVQYGFYGLIMPTAGTWVIGSSGNIDGSSGARVVERIYWFYFDGTTYTELGSSVTAPNVAYTPYGRIAATTVQTALNELIDESVVTVFGRTANTISATAGDYTATQITNTPAGLIAAVTVQAALDELDTDKAKLVGGNTFSGGTQALAAATATTFTATTSASSPIVTATTSLAVGSGTAITKIIKQAATLNFPSNVNTTKDLTVAVTGAAVGDGVTVTPSAAIMTEIGTNRTNFNAWVSAADTVTVQFCVNSAVTIDLSSGSYTIMVFKS